MINRIFFIIMFAVCTKGIFATSEDLSAEPAKQKLRFVKINHDLSTLRESDIVDGGNGLSYKVYLGAELILNVEIQPDSVISIEKHNNDSFADPVTIPIGLFDEVYTHDIFYRENLKFCENSYWKDHFKKLKEMPSSVRSINRPLFDRLKAEFKSTQEKIWQDAENLGKKSQDVVTAANHGYMDISKMHLKHFKIKYFKEHIGSALGERYDISLEVLRNVPYSDEPCH